MPTNRRVFLKRATAAATACSFARFTAADEPASAPITDTHVYIGHWPHRTLASESPDQLIAQLRKSGITQAWAGSFDGLFHKDIAAVNRRLADACAKTGSGMLIPFGTINPTLPDWEEDIRRCHETFHLPGIRLHPNYHGYQLNDTRFHKLLELAGDRGLLVQLVAWMETERHLVFNPPNPEVELSALFAHINTLPRLKLVLTNGGGAANEGAIRSLQKNPQVYFDFAREHDADEIKKLISASPDRVVFGSGAPLHATGELVAKLNQLNLSREMHRRVARLNAGELLNAQQKMSSKPQDNPSHALVSTL